MTTKSKMETAPKAAAEKEVETTTSKKSTTIKASVDFGTKKIYVRRKEVASHLPKEIRAEAIVKLSSVFVNRQPLRGFTDTETETKYLSTLLSYARLLWFIGHIGLIVSIFNNARIFMFNLNANEDLPMEIEPGIILMNTSQTYGAFHSYDWVIFIAIVALSHLCAAVVLIEQKLTPQEV
jgi:hypothetical protein